MEGFPKWRAHDLDLGSGHTAYHHASLIDLYLHAKNHWNQKSKNFLWTYVRTGGWTFETHFIRSTHKSRPKIKYNTAKANMHPQQRILGIKNYQRHWSSFDGVIQKKRTVHVLRPVQFSSTAYGDWPCTIKLWQSMNVGAKLNETASNSAVSSGTAFMQRSVVGVVTCINVNVASFTAPSYHALNNAHSTDWVEVLCTIWSDTK